MDRILTDKEVDKLELFLAWYNLPGDVIDRMSLKDLYELMVEVENKRKGA